MYVIIQNPDGTHETASEPGRGYCFREAFDTVLNELKKGAVIATIYAETPTDAEFGGLGEHLNFTGSALPLMSFMIGAKKIGPDQSEETSSEIASLASRVLRMTEPVQSLIEVDDYNDLLGIAKRLAGSALTQTPDHVPAIADDKIITSVEIDYEKVTNAIIGSLESG
jgi:hypothetical protein